MSIRADIPTVAHIPAARVILLSQVRSTVLSLDAPGREVREASTVTSISLMIHQVAAHIVAARVLPKRRAVAPVNQRRVMTITEFMIINQPRTLLMTSMKSSMTTRTITKMRTRHTMQQKTTGTTTTKES